MTVARAVVVSGLVALAAAAVALADPAPPYEFGGGVAGAPDEPGSDGAAPSNTRGSSNPLHYNNHPIAVPLSGDNERMTVRVTWETPSDWDLFVFRDVNGDGVAQNDEPLLDSSEQTDSAAEEVEVEGLAPGAKYVARVLNFAAFGQYEGVVTYFGPDPGGGPGPAPPGTDDGDPPQTTITRQPKRKTGATRVRFRFTADEPGASFECTLDRRPFRACDKAGAERMRVKRGRHKFRVRAIDGAGNVDPTPARAVFKVVR